MKRFFLIIAVLCGITILHPSIGSLMDSQQSVVFAQDIETGDSDTGDCQQTCAPMPASCNGGHVTCQALTGCTVCVCMQRNGAGQCTQWQSQINSPHQRN